MNIELTLNNSVGGNEPRAVPSSFITRSKAKTITIRCDGHLQGLVALVVGLWRLHDNYTSKYSHMFKWNLLWYSNRSCLFLVVLYLRLTAGMVPISSPGAAGEPDKDHVKDWTYHITWQGGRLRTGTSTHISLCKCSIQYSIQYTWC